MVHCLLELENSYRDCLHLARFSSAMTSIKMNSVSEGAIKVGLLPSKKFYYYLLKR